MTQNSTAFVSSDFEVPDRPTGELVIAGVTYEVRCPKLRLWMEMVQRQEDYQAGIAFKPQIQRIVSELNAINVRAEERRGRLTPDEEAESRKLVEQYTALQPVLTSAPNALQYAEILLDFISKCLLDQAQAAVIRSSYFNDHNGIDIPHLRHALDDMESQFADWFDSEADSIGVQRPELPEPTPIPAQRSRAPRKKPATTGKPQLRTRR